MTMFRTIILCGVLVSGITSMYAQVFGNRNAENRIWRVRFVADVNPELGTQYATLREKYQGERFLPATDTTDQTWIWQDLDSIDARILDFYKISSTRLGVMLNMYDDLFIGINYTNYIIQGFSTNTVRTLGFSLNPQVFWSLFSISGTAHYDWKMPFHDRLRVQPSLSVGTFQAPRFEGGTLFEGIGQERSLEGRLGISYKVNKEKPIYYRMWASYHRMSYSSQETSFVFPDRQRIIQSEWSFFTIGAGVVYDLTIEEDPDERPSGRYKRAQRKQEKLEKKQRKLEKKLQKTQG